MIVEERRYSTEGTLGVSTLAKTFLQSFAASQQLLPVRLFCNFCWLGPLIESSSNEWRFHFAFSPLLPLFLPLPFSSLFLPFFPLLSSFSSFSSSFLLPSSPGSLAAVYYIKKGRGEKGRIVFAIGMPLFSFEVPSPLSSPFSARLRHCGLQKVSWAHIHLE